MATTCKRFNQKTMMVKSGPVFRSMIDQGLPVNRQIEMQAFAASQQEGYKKGLEDPGRLKALMDGQLSPDNSRM